MLIRAYSDGSPADVVVNSVKGSQYHWKTWLRMVEQFWRQYDKQCENKGTSILLLKMQISVFPLTQEISLSLTASAWEEFFAKNITFIPTLKLVPFVFLFPIYFRSIE